MSPAQIRLGAVRAEIDRDWRFVQKQLERAASVDPARSEPEAALVALALDHAYQALEQILLRLERALSLPERIGQAWHRALLADAARPIPGIRPAIVAAGAERDWEDLLSFRHFLRHAYAAELDPKRLGALVATLARAVRETDPLIQAVAAALDPVLGE